jgi:hypothetical protein
MKKKTDSNKAVKGKFPVNTKIGRPQEYDRKAEAVALLEFADQSQCLVLEDFAPSRGYSNQRLYAWASQDTEFREALDMAKEKIGARREKLTLHKELSHPTYALTQPLYNQQLKKLIKETQESQQILLVQPEGYVSRGSNNLPTTPQIQTTRIPDECLESDS